MLGLSGNRYRSVGFHGTQMCHCCDQMSAASLFLEFLRIEHQLVFEEPILQTTLALLLEPCAKNFKKSGVNSYGFGFAFPLGTV
ncbi:hypothetical protein O1K_13823 [Xanthomonas fragariae LMG 25863]|nr:hypothetical protein O1K_13823 [Xanthomonas fragariae LMG 25863]